MSTVRPHFLHSTRTERLMMRLFVGANLTVMAFCARCLVVDYPASGATVPHIVGALVIGYFVADFASGLVHWAMDTWFSERTLGRAISIAREHHTHPQHILGYGFLEHSTLGSAPSAIFIGLASGATALCAVSVATYGLMIVWLVTSTCLFFGTSFHNLGHRPVRSRLIRWAQKLHLVVTPEHHWVHHRSDQIVRYCVINGWANDPCDRFRVWRGLEWLVHTLTGAEPRRDDLDWQQGFAKTGTFISPYAMPERREERTRV